MAENRATAEPPVCSRNCWLSDQVAHPACQEPARWRSRLSSLTWCDIHRHPNDVPLEEEEPAG